MQVQAENASDNSLNENRQVVHSLYRVKQITKKVCNNIMKSVHLSKGDRFHKF